MRTLSLVALLCVSTTAWAQSKKYPPVEPDRDLEQESRSKTWDSALDPDRSPYQELVRDAKRLVEHGDANDIRIAIEKLDAAIKRMPKEADAYAVRGAIYLQQRQWVNCADDLAAAEAASKVEDITARTRSRIDLAVCQARAGRYAESEQTLVRAIASATGFKGELMMRLGEVRIALGKLDEAIDALSASIDAADSLNDAARWLLAVAYDRARRPTDAQQFAVDAKRFDQSLSVISSPKMPFLGLGDTEYLYGIAYLFAKPTPEYALLYFKRFVAIAGDSPWKRRAEEHVRDIGAMKFPSRDTLTLSSTTVSADDIRAALEKPMAQLRQCAAKTPGTAYGVTITKSRTGPLSRETPMYRIPIEGVVANLMLDVDKVALKADIDAARDCMEKLATRISMPKPKDVNSYYRATFVVVAP
ncbi:MAG TPA: tetratricopeptide repeat protein [Kofleriaceae bacterium]|nr:tetratricopeptide repeat protein [Kofleriaceae bacterium]